MTTIFQQGPYSISTDKHKLDINVIHDFLSKESYWAKNIPLELVQRTIDGSLCFGVYHGDKQVGFARVITDKATFAYLADVFIKQEYRGQGLSKFLVRTILDYPELQGLRRWMLVTADAHGLYKQFGFGPMDDTSRLMQIHNPDAYTKKAE
jgi:GNAT superfamily N-acetyltransferase